ncbi:MAG: hypothetical protein LBQ13_04765 [Endomicrobium sp.]|jgi:hypothetical protein|nr:hypothetical protein [Endomicrobium sp.]
MKVVTAAAYSIANVIDNIIYSKDGSISFLFWMEQPEKYSLNEQKFDTRINDFYIAFKNMPKDTYLHKQDIYLKKSFDTSLIQGNMFLDEAMRRHFSDREGIQHFCILAFVITDLKSLEKNYLQNPFAYKEKLHIDDRDRLIEFEDNVKKATEIINNCYRTKVSPLTEVEAKNYIYQYVNGFEDAGYYDIDFRDKTIGEKHFDLFSFPQIEYFPDHITNIKKDDISKEEFTFWEGFMDMLGETLEYNHIYNQIIYFQGSKNIENEIDLSQSEYGKVRNLSTAVDKKANQLEAFLDKMAEPTSDIVLVKAHYNLILLENSEEELKRGKARVESLLRRNNIQFYKPQKEVLKDTFLGSIIGREKHLHRDNFFISQIKQSLCLCTNTTMPRSDAEGVWFNNRVNNLPLRVDIWDEDNRRISARNGIIIAQTGGGKSVTALNIITQYLSQGVNTIVVEFGRSFQFITLLYPDISHHISYSEDKPLGINPFNLDKKGLTPEKLSLLNTIILKTWRVKEFFDDTHVSVAVNKLLKKYYEIRDCNYCYEDFYHFVVNGGSELLQKLEINPEYFNLDSFKHIGSEFITGGRYEKVFQQDETTTTLLKEKQLIVFELTEIKKDPFLVSLVMLILHEAIDTNILADRSKRGMLLLDEFAETATIKDKYTGEEIMQTTAILYQKIRKENGAIYVIVQDPSQLPQNNYLSGMIANSQILIVLPSKELTYEGVKRTFLLKEHEMYQLYSIKNNVKNTAKPYSELFLKIGEESFVLRLELSREAFLAFQTDSSTWAELYKRYSETPDLQLIITNYKY